MSDEVKFPEKVKYSKVHHYDRIAGEHLEAGEVEQVAAVYSSYLFPNRDAIRPTGFQPDVTVFERSANDLEMIRKHTRLYNQDDTSNMHIWRRKVTYGEWELVETIPASETTQGWF